MARLVSGNRGGSLTESAIARALVAKELTDAQARAAIGDADSLADGLRAVGLMPAAAAPPSAFALLTIGQSNAERVQIHAGTELATALAGLVAASTWQVRDAAADGSALLEINSASGGHWIETGGAIGPRWQDALDAIAAAKADGLTIGGFYFNQGEGDAYWISQSAGNIDTWGEGWMTVFASLRQAAGGDPRIFWCPMNRRGDTGASQAGYNALRRKAVQLAAANPAIITLLPEMYDQDSDGGAHATPAGYKALAPRMARKIAKTLGAPVAGGVDGPRITAVARDGAIITATIVHDGGSDVTPAAEIEGFCYLIDGVLQDIGTGTRTDATHVRWTMPENVPEGANELGVSGYGWLPGITDFTKILRDNAAVPLPVRFAEAVATVTNAAVPVGPAPSEYVADPTAESASNFGFPYPAAVTVGGGKVRVRQTSPSLWTVRIKGQAEASSGTPTKQLSAGRTYRLTATSSAPADGTPYSGNWSWVTDATNVNLASGSRVAGPNFQTAPGTLVSEMTPAADSYVGFIQRNGAIAGAFDLDDITIEDITPA
jgi:hypothetical protein